MAQPDGDDASGPLIKSVRPCRRHAGGAGGGGLTGSGVSGVWCSCFSRRAGTDDPAWRRPDLLGAHDTGTALRRPQPHQMAAMFEALEANGDQAQRDANLHGRQLRQPSRARAAGTAGVALGSATHARGRMDHHILPGLPVTPFGPDSRISFWLCEQPLRIFFRRCVRVPACATHHLSRAEGASLPPAPLAGRLSSSL